MKHLTKLFFTSAATLLVALAPLHAADKPNLNQPADGPTPPPEGQRKDGFEPPDKDYNDYLFKQVRGQSIRVKGQKTLYFNGDSIMSGLATSFKDLLKGKINALYRKDIQRLIPDVKHEVTTCTAGGLLDFQQAYSEHRDFQVDVLLVNAGIHDAIKKEAIEDYEENLESLVELAHSHGIPIIWVNTIPTNDIIRKDPQFTEVKAMIDPLNAQATKVMEKHHIPIIDLNGFMRRLIDAEGLTTVYKDAYHQKPEFVLKQASFMAEEVTRIISDDSLLKKQLPTK
jgi:hypothetical protein